MFCTRRERSNTPLQALQLMNDIQHVEAARGFAARILREGGATDRQRIDYALQLTLARGGQADELRLLSETLAAFILRFTQDTKAARDLVSIGQAPLDETANVSELAAYTMLANLILNLDESVTRN